MALTWEGGPSAPHRSDQRSYSHSEDRFPPSLRRCKGIRFAQISFPISATLSADNQSHVRAKPLSEAAPKHSSHSTNDAHHIPLAHSFPVDCSDPVEKWNCRT